jgi:hypothetical protein
VDELRACQLPASAEESESSISLIGSTIQNAFKVFEHDSYSEHPIWLELDSGLLVSSVGAAPIGIPEVGLIIESRETVRGWYELVPFWKAK